MERARERKGTGIREKGEEWKLGGGLRYWI